ncbi:MAG: hypothetical protein ACI82H_000839 [Alphaproteobacteria bacterium]|jgi:hypothetical protein
MRAFIAMVLVLAAPLIGACTPESKKSLPEALRTAVDDRLVGTWHARVLGNDYVARVTKDGGGELDVVLHTIRLNAQNAGRPPLETHHKLGFFSLAGKTVIAERGPSMADDRTIHRFAAYDVAADGSITLRYTSQEEIRRFVLPLKLRAVIRSQDRTFNDILLIADSEEIAAFMGSVKSEKMFDVAFGPFTRQ